MTSLPPRALTVQLVAGDDVPAVVAMLRKATSEPVAGLAQAVREARPITLAPDWTVCSPDTAAELHKFVVALSRAAGQCEVSLGGEAVSLEFLNNQVQLKRGVHEDTTRQMDLESGYPSPETRDWLKKSLGEHGG